MKEGVGGAVLTGYAAAIEEGATVTVKLDGDGQMDATLIAEFIASIMSGEADYAKGNRFFDLDALDAMPLIRKFGGLCLPMSAQHQIRYLSSSLSWRAIRWAKQSS